MIRGTPSKQPFCVTPRRNYDINRLCRYDRRALDRKCDGCQRTTDQAYLESNGLWVVGISHQLPVFLDNNGSIERLA